MQITDRVQRRLVESKAVIGVGTLLNSAASVGCPCGYGQPMWRRH